MLRVKAIAENNSKIEGNFICLHWMKMEYEGHHFSSTLDSCEQLKRWVNISNRILAGEKVTCGAIRLIIRNIYLLGGKK